jgi:hypothetical protein
MARKASRKQVEPVRYAMEWPKGLVFVSMPVIPTVSAVCAAFRSLLGQLEKYPGTCLVTGLPEEIRLNVKCEEGGTNR